MRTVRKLLKVAAFAIMLSAASALWAPLPAHADPALTFPSQCTLLGPTGSVPSDHGRAVRKDDLGFSMVVCVYDDVSSQITLPDHAVVSKSFAPTFLFEDQHMVLTPSGVVIQRLANRPER